MATVAPSTLMVATTYEGDGDDNGGGGDYLWWCEDSANSGGGSSTGAIRLDQIWIEYCLLPYLYPHPIIEYGYGYWRT